MPKMAPALRRSAAWVVKFRKSIFQSHMITNCQIITKKLTKSPISQFVIFKQLISFKTIIEIDRVSIFFTKFSEST